MDCEIYCTLLQNNIDYLDDLTTLLNEISSEIENNPPVEGDPFPTAILNYNQALVNRLRNASFIDYVEGVEFDTVTLKVKKCTSCVTNRYNTTTLTFDTTDDMDNPVTSSLSNINQAANPLDYVSEYCLNIIDVLTEWVTAQRVILVGIQECCCP